MMRPLFTENPVLESQEGAEAKVFIHMYGGDKTSLAGVGGAGLPLYSMPAPRPAPWSRQALARRISMWSPTFGPLNAPGPPPMLIVSVFGPLEPISVPLFCVTSW